MTLYKHYNQEQLNNQYNNRLHVPDYADYFTRWEELSRQTEKEHTVFKNIFYGNHHGECLDIFPAVNASAKTFVFIHGGYWYLLDKTLFHFLAEIFLKYNITTVFINYPLAPLASIDTIVSSCRNAITWLYNNLSRFGGDPSQMYVMGHSAGAHLGSMLLVEDEMNFLKGVISLSGLFNLEPVMLSYVNDVLCMNKEVAVRNSPVHLKPLNHCPLLIVTGTNETDEFKDQSIEIYSSWKNNHTCIELLQIHGKNHYSILDAVAEKNSALQAAIFRLMSINDDDLLIEKNLLEI
jgi:arylformamidase